MDFREATGKLTEAGYTLAEIAAEIGVSENTVARARMDPNSDNHRPPPPGWREAVLRLSRRRAGQLRDVADRLEAGDP